MYNMKLHCKIRGMNFSACWKISPWSFAIVIFGKWILYTRINFW